VGACVSVGNDGTMVGKLLISVGDGVGEEEGGDE
jgi:hypothetical protein